jgi:hypothetical protein
MLKGLRPNDLSDVVCRLSAKQPSPLYYLTARPYTNAPYTYTDINIDRDKNKKTWQHRFRANHTLHYLMEDS